MRIYNRFTILTFFVLFCTSLWSQEEGTKGKVLDRNGNPVSGVVISLLDNPEVKAYTNNKGEFSLSVGDSATIVIESFKDDSKITKLVANQENIIKVDFASQSVELPYGIQQKLEESTGAISIATADKLNKRSETGISKSLYGNALGLTALQNSGEVWSSEPDFYIRGLQTLNDNSILVVIDGVERDPDYLVPEEIESVAVLRDASAVALYGYRGINGVLAITTKRGKYKTNEVNVNYDHSFQWQYRLPEFVDAYTYANAINEALDNDGESARYSANELNAFQSGDYPYLYPNVNWMDEVFKNNGYSNNYNINFRGGGEKMRYYTMFNLVGNQGFIANADVNDGYSTQMKYSKGNIRTNLDVDVTPTTKVKVNLTGVLQENSRPGLGSDGMMSVLYTVPAAAFPIKTEDGLWGGNETWGENMNPVALAQARGYSKAHTRSLLADLALTQDLGVFTEGLSASLKIAYDNTASFWEGHTMDYEYGSLSVTSWNDAGEPTATSSYSAGSVSDMDYDSYLDWQKRQFNFFGNFDYVKDLGNDKLNATLFYSYQNYIEDGQNSTYFRQNAGGYLHFVHNNKYVADVTLMTSGSNKLAPGTKWGFSPTIGAAWILSNEDFMKNSNVFDFLKLRASWGIINTDNIMEEDYWEQSFDYNSGYYLGSGTSYYSGIAEGTLAYTNSSREKAIKYNIGIDAGLFDGLVIQADGFYDKRKDVFVSGDGANSEVLGISTGYVNAGIVDSWGTEIGADYDKQLGDIKVHLGGKFTLSKNKIIDELEEPRAYDYLKETGKSVDQVFGMQAVGFFVDQADIDNSPTQQFSEVKPGDIKYKDQNGDGIINDYDQVAMGYNTTVPEIYYSFDLGFEWKGLGLNAAFQGVGNYSVERNTQSMYWPLIDDTNISQHYYDNRWTPENPNSKYPRLTTEDNANNFQTNSIWLADASFLKLRNCEVYYKVPQSYLSKYKLKSAKFYVRGIDLLCFDSIDLSDPESIGASYPMTRSVSLGFSLGF